MRPPLTPSASPAHLSCRVCTIHLEKRCYARAWWFRPFREALATGIRLFAIAYRARPADHAARTRMCHGCIRFRKNILKERSALFRRLDRWLNPLFNRVRDSLLTAEELARARKLAQRAAGSSQGGG